MFLTVSRVGFIVCGKTQPGFESRETLNVQTSSTQTQRGKLWLWLCAFFLLLTVHCTFDVSWGPSSGYACNPNDYLQFEDAQKLSILLSQQPGGVPGCLQLGWGQDRIQAAKTQLVWLREDGTLFQKEGGESKPPSLVLPKDSAGQPPRFRLFVFPSAFQGDTGTYCSNQMSIPEYNCLSDSEQSSCLAYMDFQPRSSSQSTYSSQNASTCRLYVRTTPSEQAPTESSNEPNDALDASTSEEEAPSPEERTTSPEEEPSPKKESLPEVRTPEEPGATEPSVVEQPPQDSPICSNPKACRMVVGGGEGNDHIYDMLVTQGGEMYIVGALQSRKASFGTTAITQTFGGKDIFVAKLDSNRQLLWIRVAGSAQDDEAWAIAHDGKDSLYLVGHFKDKATFGTISLSQPEQKDGASDLFVARIDTSGNWKWVVRGTGHGDDYLSDVALGPKGQIYVGGFFYGDVTLDKTYTANHLRQLEYIFAKLDTNGKWLWSQRVDTNAKYRQRNDIRFGPWLLNRGPGSSTLYAVGNVGYSIKFGSYSFLDVGFFVASFDTSGTWKSAVTGQLGPLQFVRDAKLSSSGDVIVLGEAGRKQIKLGNLTLGNPALRNSNNPIVFLAALDSQGQWKWGTSFYSEKGTCHGTAVTVDANNNLYVSGQLTGTCVFGSITAYTTTTQMFLAKWEYQSKKWAWVIKGGGTYSGQSQPDEFVYTITTDTTGTPVIAGSIFTPTFGSSKGTSLQKDLQFFISHGIRP